MLPNNSDDEFGEFSETTLCSPSLGKIFLSKEPEDCTQILEPSGFASHEAQSHKLEIVPNEIFSSEKWFDSWMALQYGAECGECFSYENPIESICKNLGFEILNLRLLRAPTGYLEISRMGQVQMVKKLSRISRSIKSKNEQNFLFAKVGEVIEKMQKLSSDTLKSLAASNGQPNAENLETSDLNELLSITYEDLYKQDIDSLAALEKKIRKISLDLKEGVRFWNSVLFKLSKEAQIHKFLIETLFHSGKVA